LFKKDAFHQTKALRKSVVARYRRKMQRVHRTINGISTTNRSRVSNGTKLLAGVDGRSPEARRFRDLIRGYEAEFETASDFDKSLIREAAFLVLKTEDLQSRHLRGENVGSDEIVRLSGQLRRVLTALKRRSAAGAPSTPMSLAEQLAGHDFPNDDGEDEGAEVNH
jgi:hypothetical protein